MRLQVKAAKERRQEDNEEKQRQRRQGDDEEKRREKENERITAAKKYASACSSEDNIYNYSSQIDFKDFIYLLYMKILYYLPAFGNPAIDIKYEILNHNISYIYNQIKTPLDMCINFYTPSPQLITNIQNNNCINKLFVHEKKGVLTELFLTNPHHSHINKYDYILFIFDDIKIVNIDIMKMIEIKEKHNFEILSPKIIKSSHLFMRDLSEGVSVNNFLEVYLLLIVVKVCKS